MEGTFGGWGMQDEVCKVRYVRWDMRSEIYTR